jgi:hypothetical protein
MNRDFLSNFERPIDQNDQDALENSVLSYAQNSEYETDGNSRFVCFVWPSGKHMSAYYNRLDKCEINDDQDCIRLVFGTETIELKGVRLFPLFLSIMIHKRKLIYCDDARYNDLADENDGVVNNISISASS